MTNIDNSSRSTHVIVLGNEKGGSGKSTLAAHIAISLMLEGMRVATVDLDGRQQTLTHYIRNRRNWAKSQSFFLPTPEHHILEQTGTDSQQTNKWADCEAFTRLLGSLEGRVDFIVIDTPGTNSPLSLMAHNAADTLVTPMNDSLIDLDTLAQIRTETGTVIGPSIYSETVFAAREERLLQDNAQIDWVVLRNRLHGADTPSHQTIGNLLEKISVQFDIRMAPGISEHLIFRDYFDKGLTALDPVECFAATARPTVEHMASRAEIMTLIEFLNLPLDARSLHRKQLREIWRESARQPLELMEILA